MRRGFAEVVIALLVAVLVVGSVLGFLVTRAYYKPKLEKLRGELEEAKGKVTELQEKASELSLELSVCNSALEKASSQLSECKGKVDELSRRVSELESELSEARSEIQQLREERDRLRAEVEELKAQLEERSKAVLEYEKLVNQTREVLFYRLFHAYNYVDGSYWYLWYEVPAPSYFHYRLDVETHTPATLENRLTGPLIRRAAGSWRDEEAAVIREVASDLWQIAGGDEELFVNLAIQVTHQLYYNVTLFTKYPVETLVEGSGDCDNLATFLASVLRAGGLDAAVILVKVPQGAHAIVGVCLSSPPDDLYAFGRGPPVYYEYNGKVYWLIEPTWARMGESWIDPASPAALLIPGSLVGDNPWGALEVVEVIEVP